MKLGIAVVSVALLAAAVPPLALWYYDGPRLGETADGMHSVFVRHDGETALELSRLDADAQPTIVQVQRAAQLLEETTAAAARFKDFDWATSTGGYSVSNAVILGRPETRFIHVWNPQFMRDGKTLIPNEPEALVYANPPGGPKQLVGVMFSAPMGTHGPQPGGNLTRWHLHQAVEFCQDSSGLPTVLAAHGVDGGCPTGMTNGPTPEMMHVWIADNPFGAFAHQMALPGTHAAHHGSRNVYASFVSRGLKFAAAKLGMPATPAPDSTAQMQHADHNAPDSSAGEGMMRALEDSVPAAAREMHKHGGQH